MKYVELTIYTTSQVQELISSALWDFTSYGVAVCDDNDVLELINKRRNTWDYLEDGVTKNLGNNATLIKCYLDLESAENTIPLITKALETLKENGKEYFDFGTLETVTRIVDGDDWIEIWRKHYRPMDMGKVVICPEWIDYEPKENQCVVKIDSNMAFGTGEHETTSMCIDFLIKYLNGDSVVIDVGTGSGILGITAIKLGAKKAVMTDIDEVAVNTAKHNAVLNGVDKNCVITLSNLLDKSDSKGSLVVANITADILCVLSKDILSHSNSGSYIILSGILKEKAQEVVTAYQKIGCNLVDSKNKGEWVALVFKRV